MSYKDLEANELTKEQSLALAIGRQRLTDHRRAKLVADGRTALAMRDRGASPGEVLSAIGGSRPRMYKAIRRALDLDGWEKKPIDPLLT